MPYVTTAEDVRIMDQQKFNLLPTSVASLLRSTRNVRSDPLAAAADACKFAILTHNGIVWEITGVLQKKRDTAGAAASPAKEEI